MSNSNITIMPNESSLLHYADNKTEFSLTYAMIKKYWRYASPDEVEYVSACTQGSWLLCNAWTASGQGGVVIVIDRSNGSIFHISNGAFAARSLVYNGVVISLCDVAYYGVSPHLGLVYDKFGIKDAWAESKAIPCEEFSSFGLRDLDKLFMTIEQGILTFGYDDKSSTVDIDRYLKEVETQNTTK